MAYKPNTEQVLGDPRWTYACTRCEWTGTEPDIVSFGYADCPQCGNSCTTDEPSHEPTPGQLDGLAPTTAG